MALYPDPQPRSRLFLASVYAAAGRGLPASQGFAGAGLNEMSEKNFDRFLILMLVLIGILATCYFYSARGEGRAIRPEQITAAMG